MQIMYTTCEQKNVQAKGMQFLVFYIIKYYIHMKHFYYVQKDGHWKILEFPIFYIMQHCTTSG